MKLSPIAHAFCDYYIQNKNLLPQAYLDAKEKTKEDFDYSEFCLTYFNMVEASHRLGKSIQDIVDDDLTPYQKDMVNYITRNKEWLEGAYERNIVTDEEKKDAVDILVYSVFTFDNAYQELQHQKEVAPAGKIYQKIDNIFTFESQDQIGITRTYTQADVTVTHENTDRVDAGAISDFDKQYPDAQVGDTIVLELYYEEPHDYEFPFARTRFVELIKSADA